MMLPHEIPATGAPAAKAARFQSLVPVIETTRLRLRAPRIEDFDVYARIIDGPGGRFLLDEPGREAAWFDFTQMVATWVLRGHGAWTIETRDGARLLGFVLIGFEPGDNEPELGFMLLPETEGQGFAAEAAKAARTHAYDALGMTTLVSTIDPDNARSIALAERLGAARDAEAEAAYEGRIAVYRHPGPEALQ